jgi:hypothetical protein
VTEKEAPVTALQKMAWIEASVWLVATFAFVVLLARFGPGPAPGAFVVIGLLPLALLVLKRGSRTPGLRLALDERDREISARADRLGLATSYVVFVLGIVGLQQHALRSGNCVPATVLMVVFWLAIALQSLVRAASIIGQSRSQEAGDRG